MHPKPGCLLIAPPSMTDQRFRKTVLLLTHHNSQGSFALCLNRPTEYTLNNISQELGLSKQLPFPIHWGGPVNMGSLWMVHTAEWEGEGTVNVNRHWNCTSSEAMFHCIADGDTPREFRIVGGMATWAPGQLEMEVDGMKPFTKKSSWLILDNPDPQWVFDQEEHKLWEEAIHLVGKEVTNTWMA